MTDKLHYLYESRLREGSLEDDPYQHAVIEHLSALRTRILKPIHPLSRLIGRSQRRPPRGLYLWGDVGRGKSMLMDLLVESLDGAIHPASLRRVHFQGFMQEVHTRVHGHGKTGENDPVQMTVDQMTRHLRVLAFDEMQVNGIADAMMLNRLFSAMLDRGVTIIATSNRPPLDLYEDVLQRDAFLPFVKLVTDHFDVVEIGGGQDHRRRAADREERWFWPNDASAQASMNKLWSDRTPRGEVVLTLQSHGRSAEYVSNGGGAVRASFNSLCEEPRSAADYIALAQSVDLLLIDDIPELGQPNRDAARRFMMLLDALYEKKVAIAASAMRPVETLLLTPSVLPEFSRTVSRVIALRKINLIH